MRDALSGRGPDAAPRPGPPPMVDSAGYSVRTEDRMCAATLAYHTPEIVRPHPTGDGLDWEARIAGQCLVIVDRGNGVVVKVTFLERHEEGRSSLLHGKPRTLPRGRGGGGSRGPADYRELVGLLIEEGCTVAVAKGTEHREVTLPDGSTVQISSTPSDYRTLPNEVARLRRKGLKLSKF